MDLEPGLRRSYHRSAHHHLHQWQLLRYRWEIWSRMILDTCSMVHWLVVFNHFWSILIVTFFGDLMTPNSWYVQGGEATKKKSTCWWKLEASLNQHGTSEACCAGQVQTESWEVLLKEAVAAALVPEHEKYKALQPLGCKVRFAGKELVTVPSLFCINARIQKGWPFKISFFR